ncbi:sugar O-acetyltransferase [Streptococcus sp. zg-JUN1979]|uniref:sugar O-acetyltransferase n=1 Tax=Streptococcus sp. zg-JUN1979 TaxID=3391450 RepID=UPI0039A5C787
MPTEREKMLAGQPYNPADKALIYERQQTREKIMAINHEKDATKRSQLFKELVGSVGEDCHIETGFVCDYGSNIHLGERFFSNFNQTFLDVCPITIGDDAMIGPNCQLLTPIHPLDPIERVSGIEYGAPITIGDKVWLGAGVTILPGVSLGDNVVVGAGSVVTSSFGSNVVLAGNPARVIKTLASNT